MAESMFGFSGLSSGVQWHEMVDQLMAIEARPIQKIESQIATLQSRSQAWNDFRSRIDGLRGATTGLADATAFRAFSSSIAEAATGAAGFSISAGSDARPGSYSVQVLNTAVREKLGSGYIATRTEALGQEGDFLVNGTAVAVEAGDTLDDVASRINAARAGVTASILTVGDNHRLVLTSESTGAGGIEVIDGGAGVLRSLGLVQAEAGVLKHGTSNGALSDGFATADTAIATLRGLAAPDAATITIGDQDVAVDLGTMSLNDVAAAINAAGPTGVTAAVESDDDGGYRLRLDGTTTIEGDGTSLEMLGLREAGRGGTARVVQGAQLGDGTGTMATLLTDLGGVVGDTLTIAGMAGNGVAIEATELEITGTTTLQDVADELQARLTAAGQAATIGVSDDGRFMVTDSTTGDSALAVQITSHNSPGGTLDFGAFEATEQGFARELLAGRDAEFLVDGVRFTRSTNAVSDVIEGSTLTLQRAGEAHEVSVTQDAEAITKAVKDFVDKFNGVLEHIDNQSSYPEGGKRPALYGETWLRSVRSELRSVLQSVLPAAVTDRSRLAEVGIEIQKDGQFSFDADKLEAALASDPTSVERLFGTSGVSSTSRLEYITASDETVEGTYDVTIGQAAARAELTGAARTTVAGADTMVIRDPQTGAEYQVALDAGESMSEVADSIRAELGRATREEVTGSVVFYTDAAKTEAAGEATRLDSLFQAPDDGAASEAVVAEGDVLTFSGTSRYGGTFTTQYTVGADDTVGDVRTALQDALGPDVAVSVENGRFVVQEQETGNSEFSLSITSSQVAAGALSFGTFDTTVEGRAAAEIDVELVDAGGGAFQLALSHQDYGSAAGFEISYDTGLADIGLAAGDYRGLDVEAIIGGHAVTGTGTNLRGPADTEIAGLRLAYDGTDTGDLGSLTFNRGVAGKLDRVFDRLLGSEGGSIQARAEAAENQVPRLEQRIADMELRLENRREALTRRFIAMEQAMAAAQSQSAWLTSQISGLPGYSSNGER